MGGRLLTLTLERCGITDYQLECLLRDNPLVRELRLKKCNVLSDEIFEAMARSSALTARLTHLDFTDTANEAVNTQILPYIGELKALRSLSLRNAVHIPDDPVKHLNATEWLIPDLTLPVGDDPSTGEGAETSIEVDDGYK